MLQTPKQRILAALALVLLFFGLVTGISARLREGKVMKVMPGMPKAEVEQLLGPGRPDNTTSGCEGCSAERTKFVYKGNPSLWFGHIEDALVVCYDDDVVCATLRVSL